MLYLGKLLHVEIKKVAYLRYWLLFVSSALLLGILFKTCNVQYIFFFNADARIGFGLLKYYIFRGQIQTVFL